MKLGSAPSCQSRFFMLHCLAKLSWLENRYGHGIGVETHRNVGCLALCLSPFRQGLLLNLEWRMAASKPSILLSLPVGHRSYRFLSSQRLPCGYGHMNSVGPQVLTATTVCHLQRRVTQPSLDIKWVSFLAYTHIRDGWYCTFAVLVFDYLGFFFHLCSYKKIGLQFALFPRSPCQFQ